MTSRAPPPRTPATCSRGSPSGTRRTSRTGCASRPRPCDRELTGTLADLAAAREAAGDAAGALQVVRRWLAADPLHEPAHRALIRLYAARPATGPRRCRSTATACGRCPASSACPPLPETTAPVRRRQPRLVRPGPPVARRAPDPAEPVPGRPPFVGRADELRALRRPVRRHRRRRRRRCRRGRAGHREDPDDRGAGRGGAARGGRALVLRAHEDEVHLAYAPVVEALRGRARAGGPGWTGLAPAALDQAARLVPELAEGRSTAPAEPAYLDGPGAEFRFLGGLWDVVVAAAAGTAPGLVVVEDVQWADDATLALLGHGIRRLGGAGSSCCSPGGRRSSTPSPGRGRRRPTVRSSLPAGAAGPGRGRAAGAGGPPGGDDAPAVVPAVGADRGCAAAAGGVPAGPRPGLRGADAARGVRDVMRARLEPLSPTARQVLSAAAVTGRSFAVDTVRVVSGRTDEETVSAPGGAGASRPGPRRRRRLRLQPRAAAHPRL